MDQHHLLDNGKPMNRMLSISELQYTQPEIQVDTRPTAPKKRKSSKDTGAPAKRKMSNKAAKACNECRKQKSKCFAFNNNIGCLRCSSLGKVCSFEEESLKKGVDVESLSNSPNVSIKVDDDYGAFGPSVTNALLNRPLRMPGQGVDSRLHAIQQDVSKILSLLGDKQQKTAPVSPINNLNQVKIRGQEFDVTRVRSFGKPSSAFVTSPYMIYSSVCSESALPSPVSQLVNPTVTQHIWPQRDIITLKILTIEQALSLLQHFRDRYGRWVSFPESFNTEMIMKRLRARCPLLLTVACTLALKYSDPYLKTQVYKLLLHTLQTDLNACMLQIPQSLEFLQALMILSIYGLSFSSESFSIDAWYLSGCALQHFITKDSLGTLIANKDDAVSPEFQKLTTYRVWNHLSLVHIVYCILSGRQCIIDEVGFVMSRKILDLPSSTNFDGRMIAELTLHLTVYNFLQSTDPQSSLAMVRDELRYWLEQWGYLFDQPANEFVEMGYHHGYLMVLYNWNHRSYLARNPELDPASVSVMAVFDYADSLSMRSMLFHAQKVVEAVNSVENDSYFAFLSNQIHLAALSATLMLIKVSSSILKRNLVTSEQGTGGVGIIGDAFALDSAGLTDQQDPLNKIEFTDSELKSNLTKCVMLGNRFKRISTTDDDASGKFSAAIEEVMISCFPGFVRGGSTPSY